MQTNKSRLIVSASHIQVFVLSALWMLGIISGLVVSEVSSFKFSFLMGRAIYAPVSFVNLLISAMLPFALTFAAIWFNKPRLIYLLCFVKGFAIGFTGNLCLICFGSAGWFVRGLLLFSQIAIVPAYWYLWIWFSGRRLFLEKRVYLSLSSYLSMVVLLDYYCVVPFLCGLSS